MATSKIQHEKSHFSKVAIKLNSADDGLFPVLPPSSRSKGNALPLTTDVELTTFKVVSADRLEVVSADRLEVVSADRLEVVSADRLDFERSVKILAAGEEEGNKLVKFKGTEEYPEFSCIFSVGRCACSNGMGGYFTKKYDKIIIRYDEGCWSYNIIVEDRSNLDDLLLNPDLTLAVILHRGNLKQRGSLNLRDRRKQGKWEYFNLHGSAHDAKPDKKEDYDEKGNLKEKSVLERLTIRRLSIPIIEPNSTILWNIHHIYSKAKAYLQGLSDN